MVYHRFIKLIIFIKMEHHSNSKTISIRNKRIIEFCCKHPSFDIERSLLKLIEFMEETYSATVPCLDTNLALQIMENLKALNNKVETLDSTITNRQFQLQKEYIEDLKSLLSINNTEKIIPSIKEYNEAFSNKMTLLFKDLIPQQQTQQTNQLQSILKGIEQTVVIEMNKGITMNSLDSLMNNIEHKFANILTHSEQKIASVLNAVSENKQEDKNLHTKLDHMLTKLGKNNEKGKISENILHFNLQEIYPTADIKNMSHTPHAADYWLIRKDKPPIIVENKNFDGTVYSDDVQKFINDMNTNDMCGIMISQNSNIVHRENYEIEIHNGNVAVYIHECQYDPRKIKIAVQIIDTFKMKIEQQCIKNGLTCTVEKETLQKINKEFQLFNIKKEQHIAEIRNMYDTLIRSAEEMELNALDDLLESFGILTNIKKHLCGKCSRTFKTKKGLDTHERLCAGIIEQSSKHIQCQYCDHIAKTQKGYKSHCSKVHSIQE